MNEILGEFLRENVIIFIGNNVRWFGMLQFFRVNNQIVSLR